jgi:molybdopterin-guanine dinucleotide biosynthesis protein A
MPFVNADLLAFEHGELLATQADLAIPQTPHGLEPFHAVYRRAACLPWMKEALDSGQWRVDAWLGKATVRYVTPAEVQRFDPARLAFWNINTPAELAKAERIARQAQP